MTLNNVIRGILKVKKDLLKTFIYTLLPGCLQMSSAAHVNTKADGSYSKPTRKCNVQLLRVEASISCNSRENSSLKECYKDVLKKRESDL